jgi:ring-1,2-phenylacetyl-CoA epoxidase subunit PaaE
VTVILDGLSATAPLSRAQTILDGAQVSRSDLPFACKGGVCGTCRALVREGEVDMRRNYELEGPRSPRASCSPARASRSATA